MGASRLAGGVADRRVSFGQVRLRCVIPHHAGLMSGVLSLLYSPDPCHIGQARAEIRKSMAGSVIAVFREDADRLAIFEERIAGPLSSCALFIRIAMVVNVYGVQQLVGDDG